VLYLCFFFPPSRASGVFRGRATANHLAAAGWDVTVVTAPREFFHRHLDGAADESLEATVDPAVRVERPRMNTFVWEHDVRRFGRFRRNAPVLAEWVSRSLHRAVFPEHYLGWVPGVLRRALVRHARRPFDLIVATGNPFVSFPAAWLLGRLLRRPYVLDYRDSWTFNQFTDEPLHPEGSLVPRWEARVVRDAAEVVFVNQVMLDRHARRYPAAAGRMRVLANGWDPDVLGDVPFSPPPPDRPLRFAYLGTVTPHLPLDVMFEGWRRARAHPLLAGAGLAIHGHLGFFPYQVAPLRARVEAHADAGVTYEGPFAKTEAAGLYARTDALVFCPGGSRYVTSGKVFEYMAAGKPVVSVHEPGIAAEEVLRGYPLWSPCEQLDPDAAAGSFIAAAKAARDTDRATHEAAVAHARRYARDATMAPWEARLRRLVPA
jgi:glycosyltransferase involved in cell wall biosynthesis